MRDEQTARQHLRQPLHYPSLVSRPGASDMLQLFRRPSFDPEAVWVLLRDGQDYFVRRVVYIGRPHDTPALNVHNTYGSEGAVAPNMAGAIMDELSELSFNPFASDSKFGLDGCTYGLKRKGFYLGAELSWWCQAPESWAGLRDWYGRTVLQFETCLPASTVPLHAHHPWV